MYGHLNPNVSIEVEQAVSRGEQIGTVLRRTDQTPNHLHFEIRTFLMTNPVNGAAPRFPFRCGVDCPPGPGYWPFGATSAGSFGWRNPTHVIAHRAFPRQGGDVLGEIVATNRPISSTITLWSEPPEDAAEPAVVATITIQPARHYPLLGVEAGPEDTRATSAQSYRLWYRIQIEDGRIGWAQAAVPSTFETGGDGRPSTVSFNFLPSGALAP
jgi:hypothetical protein